MVINFKKRSRLVALGIAAAVVIMIICFVMISSRGSGYARRVSSNALRTVTIIVDAGHGGMDGGAVGTDTGVVEAGLNLSVALRLKEALEAQGITVIMTREDGDALAETKQADMQARREILRRADVDLVVSVHMNKFSDRSVAGAMAYYMQGSAEGEALAQSVINSVCDAIGQKRRAANPGDYFVIRECAVPAVLVECGFLSNAGDEKRLQDAAHQQALADAICAGVLAYMENRS